MTWSLWRGLIDRWHDSFVRDNTDTYVTWLIHTRKHSYVCQRTLVRKQHVLYGGVSLIRDVTWLIRMWQRWFICDMTHSYVTTFLRMSNDSFGNKMEFMEGFRGQVTWLISMWQHVFIRDMTIPFRCGSVFKYQHARLNRWRHDSSVWDMPFLDPAGIYESITFWYKRFHCATFKKSFSTNKLLAVSLFIGFFFDLGFTIVGHLLFWGFPGCF